MPTCKNLWIEYIEIGLNDDLSVKQIKQKRYKVLGQDKTKYVVDDDWFTKLDKLKEKRGRYQFNQFVGEIKISDYSKDDYFKKNWGLLVVKCFHFCIRKAILQNRINKAVNSHIRKQIGAYSLCGKCEIKL